MASTKAEEGSNRDVEVSAMSYIPHPMKGVAVLGPSVARMTSDGDPEVGQRSTTTVAWFEREVQ